ncbi:MAG: sigma-70 family RNA polymerase sigma factor [Oscillospiraceae bacterium]|nr:sigma-70 family RNA polymerase sigma factor [Oscillospiraceae bacterium]
MDSIDQVVRNYSDMLYRLAFARAGNSHDAEDIVQDVFLSYIRAGKTYKDEEHRKAWLIRTAINVSINLASSAWKRRSGGEFDENTGSFDENLERVEAHSVVYPAVQSLPEKYRVVIHLFYYEDMPINRISKVTGLGENTVKSRLKRARVMMKEKLGGVADDFR